MNPKMTSRWTIRLLWCLLLTGPISGHVLHHSPNNGLMRHKRESVPFIREILTSFLYRVQERTTFETTGDLARLAGYDVEDHEVVTEDGYILALHRLVKKDDLKRGNENNDFDILNDVNEITNKNQCASKNCIKDKKKKNKKFKKTTNSKATHITRSSRINDYNNMNAAFKYPISTQLDSVASFPTFFERLYRFLSWGPSVSPSVRDVHVSRKGLPQYGDEVVFLQHGLMGSSDNWNTNKKEDSLAYLLSDAGYDVWMGNFRGNVYSRGHTNLTHYDDQFWAFSYDEMGKYDLPAMINYVVKATEGKKIHYIGHSMGSTAFFAGMSMYPDLQTHIKDMIALAPVATVLDIKSPIKYLAYLAKEMQRWLSIFGGSDNVMNNRLLISLWDHYRVCRSSAMTCQNLQFWITGFDPERAEPDMVPLIFSHNPAGSSTRTLFHFAQGVTSGKFQRFDFGEKMNLEKYGQDRPPEYNISSIDIPIALFAAPNDWWISVKDIAHLKQSLPNVVQTKWVENPIFSHLDFLWARDAKELVYEQILQLLQSMNTSS